MLTKRLIERVTKQIDLDLSNGLIIILSNKSNKNKNISTTSIITHNKEEEKTQPN